MVFISQSWKQAPTLSKGWIRHRKAHPYGIVQRTEKEAAEMYPLARKDVQRCS